MAGGRKYLGHILLLSMIWILLFSADAVSITKDYAIELGQTASGLGKKFALVIGVEHYAKNPLPWAGKDAQKIGTVLDDIYGFEVTALIGKDNTTKQNPYH